MKIRILGLYYRTKPSSLSEYYLKKKKKERKCKKKN